MLKADLWIFDTIKTKIKVLKKATQILLDLCFLKQIKIILISHPLLAYYKATNNLENRLDSRNSVDVDHLKNLNGSEFNQRRSLPSHEFIRQIEDMLLSIP